MEPTVFVNSSSNFLAKNKSKIFSENLFLIYDLYILLEKINFSRETFLLKIIQICLKFMQSEYLSTNQQKKLDLSQTIVKCWSSSLFTFKTLSSVQR